MAQLKNSLRISYKATYVQVSSNTQTTAGPANPGTPPVTVNPTTQLQRALEKTAFIQVFQLVPSELSDIKSTFLEQSSADMRKNSGEITVLNAIEQLVSDTTGMSTLNNASAFAGIDYKTLIEFAYQIVEHRQIVAESIKNNIADILKAYKASVLKPFAKIDPANTASVVNDPASDTKTETSRNTAGIAIKRIVFPSVNTTADNKGKVNSYSFKAIISVEDAGTNPVSSKTNPGKASSDLFKPANNDAIGWAETNEPELFKQLLTSMLPYMGLADNESEMTGKTKSVLDFLDKSFVSHFNKSKYLGIISGFESRMQIEPVGNLHLERVEMYPAGIERGELIHSVPLAPNETVNISHKEWSVTEKEFDEIVDDYFEGYSEAGVAEKNDMAMSNDSQSKHSTALNIGSSLSASYSSVTLSSNFGYNATSDDQLSKKDSRNHSMELTKKASSRTKKDHKVTFKVSSVAGSEDQSVRVITNPSDTDAMRIDYFQLARKWKVDLLRYGLRMTYDIVIPNPGSGIVTKVLQAKSLQDLINQPFSFNLPLSAVNIGNYNTLGATYGANVTAPPEVEKWVSVHKETQRISDDDYDNGHVFYDPVDFEIDENYIIDGVSFTMGFQNKSGDTNYLFLINGDDVYPGGVGNTHVLDYLIGKSGIFSIEITYQYIYNYGINITFHCRPKTEVIDQWRLQAWNQLMQGALDAYSKNLEFLKDQLVQITDEINRYDALTLRRMEMEEIMKAVLRWLFGPNFYLVPFNIAQLFGYDSNDPTVKDVLDPNQLSAVEWMNVMEQGEFIKYIHNAIEWENVLYFTYPYFWDDNTLWDFKKFLFHPDPTHRTFLRSGAARVVLTIRPGFEPSFTQLVETGAFGSLPGTHPYVTIAQEIQNFANTNYPGFPPANPEQNARPLLYLEQRRVWKEMQYLIQLLNAFKTDPANNGSFPTSTQGLAVLSPYIAGINAANQNANTQQLLLDPMTPQEALLPVNYAVVPLKDFWGTDYFYQSPGNTGDYDLISYGADGVPGGEDKNADISANAEASLISTWYEYSPTNALDISITMNKAGVVPPPIDSSLA